MKTETGEVIGSIYLRVEKQRSGAVEARGKARNELQRLMLAGKVKAYTDVLCLLKDRYGSKLALPPAESDTP